MEENNNNDEVLEITENEEGSNDGIKIANDLKVAEVSKWWIELIFGIVILLIGLVIVVMCNTKIAREILMIIFGVSLLVNGILSLVSYFILDFKLKKLNEKQQNEDFKDYKVK